MCEETSRRDGWLLRHRLTVCLSDDHCARDVQQVDDSRVERRLEVFSDRVTQGISQHSGIGAGGERSFSSKHGRRARCEHIFGAYVVLG